MTSHIYNNFTTSDGSAAPPMLLLRIKGTSDSDDTAVLYGHADKQPMMAEEWTVTQPDVPLRDGDNLYGRGSADDGYAVYAAVLAIKANQHFGYPYPDTVIMIETEEESGSKSLNDYLNFMKSELHLDPGFLGVFDSGSLTNNENFWAVSSMRGAIAARLRIELTEGALHSGNAGGVVPSPYRVLNDLLQTRLEDPRTGAIIAAPLMRDIEEKRIQDAYALAEAQGDAVFSGFGFLEGVSPNFDGSEPSTQDIADMIVRLTLTSQLTLVGFSHETMPNVGEGGQTIFPFIEVDLSIRTAPGLNETQVALDLEKLMTANPPYGAKITYTPQLALPNFLAPVPKPWLDYTLETAAQDLWGQIGMSAGRGGTVPMMSEFQSVFGHNMEILASGVLAPYTGHHGPNEFLELNAAKRITGMMSNILASQANKDTFVDPRA